MWDKVLLLARQVAGVVGWRRKHKGWPRHAVTLYGVPPFTGHTAVTIVTAPPEDIDDPGTDSDPRRERHPIFAKHLQSVTGVCLPYGMQAQLRGSAQRRQ